MADASAQECWFCAPSRGEDEPPGGWIHQDEHFVAGHAPHGYGPAGLVIVESRRHLLDTSELNPAEAAGYGPVLGRVTGAIREVVAAERVYTWSSMKAHPHLHVWLLPWRAGLPVGIDLLASMSRHACTSEEAHETAAKLRAALTS